MRLLPLATALALIASPLFAKEKQVGMIVSLKGKAEVLHKSGKKEKARLAGRIFEGDRITTGFQSFLQIDFIDHSKINLMGSSDVTIDEYVWTKGKDSKSKVHIENGALGFMAGKIKKIAPENYKVKTASATVGIRGSSGELQTSDGSLPGVPAGFAVMMTGGEGLTVETGQEDAAGPVLDITSIGTGVAMGQDAAPKVIAFATAPTQTYADKTEKKVASAKAQVARQESTATATQSAEKKVEPQTPASEQADKKSEPSKAPVSQDKPKPTQTAAADQGQKTAETPKASSQETASLAPVAPPPVPEPAAEPPPVEVIDEAPPVEIEPIDLGLDEVTEEIAEESQEIVEETPPPPPAEPEPPCGELVWEEEPWELHCDPDQWTINHPEPEEPDPIQLQGELVWEEEVWELVCDPEVWEHPDPVEPPIEEPPVFEGYLEWTDTSHEPWNTNQEWSLHHDQ